MRDEDFVEPALQTLGVAVVMAMFVAVAVIMAVIVAVVVAVTVQGVCVPAHDACPGAVPSACSAWWMASMTSWRA